MENITDMEVNESVQDDVDAATAPSTSTMQQAPQPAVTASAGSVLRQALLARLLRMAQRYRQEGNARQATEMFWTLIQEHPDTPEAAAAQAELLSLAEGYERDGNQHMARSMYEKLMDLED